jgi:hemolysin activation/secretion protein
VIDYRQPKNARKGGWYRFEASHYEEQTDRFTFNRFDADLRQYASILAERRVLAVRLFVSTSEPAAGARVPFYLMPALGGHDTLRGFRDYRFRGPHAILTQTEYRFEVWSGLDAALFYDAGKVALSRSNHNFKNLEDAYGFGFRFNTDNGTILRIDAGFGSSDGKHLYIVFGDVF